MSSTENIQHNLSLLLEDPSRWQDSPYLGEQRVVFWYDADAALSAEFDALDLPGLHKHQLHDHNLWQTKQLLHGLSPDSRLLIYAAYPEPAPEDNWLLGAQLAGNVFQADRAALLLTELGLHNLALLPLINTHMRFFDSRERTQALKDMRLSAEAQPYDFSLGLLCASLRLRTLDAPAVLRKLLTDGLDEETNPSWQQLHKWQLTDAFWEVCGRELDWQAGDYPPGLRRLFLQLAISHAGHVCRGTLPVAWRELVISPDLKAYHFVAGWLHHREQAPHWQALSDEAAQQLGLSDTLSETEAEAWLDVETFREIDRHLIRQMVEELHLPHPDTRRLQRWIEHRQPLFWFGVHAFFYRALQAALRLQDLLNEPAQDGADFAALFAHYQQRLWEVDQAYRQYFQASNATRPSEVLRKLDRRVEDRYNAWQHSLGERWSEALEHHLATSDWQLPGVVSQTDFYDHYLARQVRSASRKVFVIISDALRLEVAHELRERLAQELRGDASVDTLLGCVPSVTRYGMAALLPRPGLERLRIDARGMAVVNGTSTEGLAQRQRILSETVGGAAFDARDILRWGRDEGRERLKSVSVAYFYHNLIDATGDKHLLEEDTFEACAQTLSDLRDMTQRLVNSFNASEVIITADHGFLFQYSDLAQYDKLPLPDGEWLYRSRRFALGTEALELPGTHCIPLDVDSSAPLYAVLPRGSLRFAIQGGGSRFVHGGAMPQEICVPVLSYTHKRAAKSQDNPLREVGFQILNQNRRITTNRLLLHLLQTEPVQDKVRARTLRMAFLAPDGQLISNQRKVVLNSSSDKATEREQRLAFSFTGDDLESLNHCILQIDDDATGQNLAREHWPLRILISDEFGMGS